MEAKPGHRAEAEGDARVLYPSHRHRRQDYARPARRSRGWLGSNCSGTRHALGHELVAGNCAAPACRIHTAVAEAMAAAAHARAGRRWCREGSAKGFEGERVGGVTTLLTLAEEEEGGTDIAAGEGVLKDGERHAFEQGQALACRHGVELAAGLKKLLELGLGEEGLDIGQGSALSTGGLSRAEAVDEAEAQTVGVDAGLAEAAGAHDQGHSMSGMIGSSSLMLVAAQRTSPGFV
jgi:hypothetical protein